MAFDLSDQGTTAFIFSLSDKVPLEVTVVHAAAVATQNNLAVVTHRNILLVALTTQWSDGNLITANKNRLLVVMVSVNAEDETGASLGGCPNLVVLGEPVELWVRLGADVETWVYRISESFT